MSFNQLEYIPAIRIQNAFLDEDPNIQSLFDHFEFLFYPQDDNKTIIPVVFAKNFRK